MNNYSAKFYKEILECYEYETRNPSIYGNVIRGEMEFTQSSEERRSDQQGDEDHVQRILCISPCYLGRVIPRERGGIGRRTRLKIC